MMSDPIASRSPAGEDHSVESAEPLQFDRAEFEAPAADGPPCAVCNQPIPDEYYEISGKVMCPRCRHGVEAAFRGGSPLARFLKATVFGIGAAVVGAIIFYVSVRMKLRISGLVSILVGFTVGMAVRKGTGNRGGGLYQLLAVFLTYTSIGVMLLTVDLLPAWVEEAAKPAPPPAVENPGNANEKAKAPDPERLAPPEPPAAILVAVALMALIYSLPVRVVMSFPIAGFIYAFALWEAWKLNRPVRLVFNGPFRLGEAGAAVPKPEGIVDGV
jgi:hypothetical protein